MARRIGFGIDDASHLMFVCLNLVERALGTDDVVLDFTEHIFGTGNDFLFRDPKTGIDVPEFCETGIEVSEVSPY